MLTLTIPDELDAKALVCTIIRYRFPELVRKDMAFTDKQLVEVMSDPEFQAGLATYMRYATTMHCGTEAPVTEEWDSYTAMARALVRAGCAVDYDPDEG